MGCARSRLLVPLTHEDGQQGRTIVFTKTCRTGLGVLARPNSQNEAVVFDVFDGGLINIWNHRNPDNKVTKGDRILSVNGATGFWPMMFELQNRGTHAIVIRSGSLDDFVGMDGGSGQDEDITVSEDLVKSLPVAFAAECVDMECSICLEELGELEAIVRLPCNHCFHKFCAEKWLTRRKGSCPLCTAPVASTNMMNCKESAEANHPPPHPSHPTTR